MTALRGLNVSVGRLPVGELDSIADVEGVQVGHASVGGFDVRIGLSVVLPYPRATIERKLFVGRWALDRGGAASALGVAEDFGTLSSPIALVPAPAFGRAYEALIHQGIARDSGLSTDAGWPPVVIGMDDGAWNDARRVYESVEQRDIDRAIEAASQTVVEGNVGIGRALRAFGLRGGVGTASRCVNAHCVGVFVAVNGGLPGDLRLDGRSVALPSGQGNGPQEFAAVIATDAPLLPFQLNALAQRAALGAGRCGLWNVATREAQVWAFSTSEAQADAQRAELVRLAAVDDSTLYGLFAAAAEATEAAVFSALVAAEPLKSDSHQLDVLDVERLKAAGEAR